MTPYGAAIERGVIIDMGDDGYKVSSFSRYGLITPFIPAINNDDYHVGSHVYFFLFDDGRGAILAAFD